jgi:hypothetical protein
MSKFKVILFLILFFPLLAKAEWEDLSNESKAMFSPTCKRQFMPDGWLIYCSNSVGAGLTFYPDKNHTWRIR